jgi:hypothetical protein
MSLVAGSINVELNAAVQDFIRGFDQAIAKVDKMAGKSESLGQKSLNKLNQGLENTANLMKTGLLLGTTAAVGAFAYLGKTAVDNAAQFETFRSTLKVMLGTQELANQRLQEYSDIGKNTPFELPQVVALGNQLQSIGKYSKDNVMMLGDLASAAGKPIEQVSGAFTKLATGQKGVAVDMFRDLLITTDDWTKATGKGISKSGELMATTQEMMAVLPKIMKDKKFIGMMDEQSKTFVGKMSNLMDTFNQKLVEVGDKLLPHIKPVIDKLIEIIGSVDVDGLFKSFSNLFNLLYKGDYTGGFFGFGNGEDSKIIDDLFKMRETAQGLYDILFNGNYTAPIWGEMEDSALVDKIFTFRESAIELFEKIKIVAQSLSDLFMQHVWPSLQQLGTAFMELWAVVQPYVLPTLQVLGVILGAVIVGAIIALGAALKGFAMLMTWWANDVKQKIIDFQNNFENTKKFVTGLADTFYNTFGGVKDFMDKVFGGIGSLMLKGLKPAFELLRKVRESLNGKEILGFKINIPEIPQFATGINNFKGGMALVGEKGPEVVELPQGSKVNANAQSKNMGNTTNIMNYILQQDSYSSLRLQRV